MEVNRMSKQYEVFWKYHNKDNMDIHAVKLIEHLEAENKRLTELLNSKEKADTALISG